MARFELGLVGRRRRRRDRRHRRRVARRCQPHVAHQPRPGGVGRCRLGAGDGRVNSLPYATRPLYEVVLADGRSSDLVIIAIIVLPAVAVAVVAGAVVWSELLDRGSTRRGVAGSCCPARRCRPVRHCVVAWPTSSVTPHYASPCGRPTAPGCRPVVNTSTCATIVTGQRRR